MGASWRQSPNQGLLTTFPNAKFDDQTDSTSQALAWTKQRPAAWGLWEYYRRLAEEARTGKSAIMVRLRVPVGISHLCTLTGRQVAVGPDGTIEVSEEGARPLYGAGFNKVDAACAR